MSLRVMTYNILDGGVDREVYILDVIQKAQPDLVILQEIFSEDLLKFLSQSLGMNYYFGAEKRKRKVALLSKLPVLNFTSHHPTFPIWRNFIEADIEYEPGGTIRIIGVHPIANLGIIFEVWRLWEAKYIITHATGSGNTAYLIAGDFNAIAPGETVRTESMPTWLKWILSLQGNRVYHFSIQAVLSAGFLDCFRLLHSEEGFTLPPPHPNARLDYIFVNAAMKDRLRECWVIREPARVNLASDHYPVMAEFSFTG